METYGMEVVWKGKRGALLSDAPMDIFDYMRSAHTGWPDFMIIHLGCNDFMHSSSLEIHWMVKNLLEFLKEYLPNTTIVWSFILPRLKYNMSFGKHSDMSKKLRDVNRNARNLFWKAEGKAIAHSDIDGQNKDLFRGDNLHLSPLGLDIFVNGLKGALEYFVMLPAALRFPTSME
jgi:lysophospholipase L1-like esterase